MPQHVLRTVFNGWHSESICVQTRRCRYHFGTKQTLSYELWKRPLRGRARGRIVFLFVLAAAAVVRGEAARVTRVRTRVLQQRIIADRGFRRAAAEERRVELE